MMNEQIKSPREPQKEHLQKWNLKKSRRLSIIYAGVLLAILVLLIAGWFFVANKLDREISNALNEVNQNGRNLNCENRQVVGFPFRIGLSCLSLSLRDQQNGLFVSTGPIRTAAQIYAPNHIISEIVAPLSLDTSRLFPLELGFTSLRSSLRLRRSKPQRIIVEGSNFKLARKLEAQGYESLANTNELFAVIEAVPENSRQLVDYYDGDDRLKDLRLFVELSDLDLDGFAGLNITLSIKTYIQEGAMLLAQPDIHSFISRSQNGQIEIESALVKIGQASLMLKGIVTISPDGLLNGTLDMTAENLGNMLEVISQSISPDKQDLTTQFALASQAIQSLARPVSELDNETDGKNVQKSQLPSIVINKGNVSLGFIPIGYIPSIIN